MFANKDGLPIQPVANRIVGGVKKRPNLEKMVLLEIRQLHIGKRHKVMPNRRAEDSWGGKLLFIVFFSLKVSDTLIQAPVFGRLENANT